MRLSITAIGLAALVLPGAARAQPGDWRDQALYARPIVGVPVPRPLAQPICIDGAMLGALRRDTHEVIVDPHSPYRGSTRYWLAFSPARLLFGGIAPQAVRFSIIGDATIPLGDNVVLFVRREESGALAFVHADYAIADRGNRPFIPLVWAPLDGFRGSSWLPRGYGPYARPIRYWDSAMHRHGHSAAFLAEVADAGDFNRNWVRWRDGRAVVARGIYLDSLPAMFARQSPANCWRPGPDLANSDPSR
jgi:hypothetical protein